MKELTVEETLNIVNEKYEQIESELVKIEANLKELIKLLDE